MGDKSPKNTSKLQKKKGDNKKPVEAKKPK